MLFLFEYDGAYCIFICDYRVKTLIILVRYLTKTRLEEKWIDIQRELITRACVFAGFQCAVGLRHKKGFDFAYGFFFVFFGQRG